MDGDFQGGFWGWGWVTAPHNPHKTTRFWSGLEISDFSDVRLYLQWACAPHGGLKCCAARAGGEKSGRFDISGPGYAMGGSDVS